MEITNVLYEVERGGKYDHILQKFKKLANGDEIAFQQYKTNFIYFLSNVDKQEGIDFLVDLVDKIDFYNLSVDAYNYIRQKLYDDVEFGRILIKSKDNSSSAILVNTLIKNNEIDNFDVERVDLSVPNKIKFAKEECLFIDDFVGTGDTCIKIKERLDVNKNFSVLCYLITTDAKKRLEEKGIKVHYCRITKTKKEMNNKAIIALVKKFESENIIAANCYSRQGTLCSDNFNSPNNNLVFLWKNTLKYNQKSWVPLLRRAITFDKMSQNFITEMIDKNKEKFNKAGPLNNSHLKMLFLISQGTNEIIQQKKICGFDTKIDVEKHIEKLEEFGYIENKSKVTTKADKYIQIFSEALGYDYIKKRSNETDSPNYHL